MELALVRSYKDGNHSCFQELLIMYKTIIEWYSRQYFATGITKEDLFQEGSIGLWKAVESYQIERGTFRSFAILHIKGQIINAIKGANRYKQQLLNRSLSLQEPFMVGEDARMLIDMVEDHSAMNPEDCILTTEKLEMNETRLFEYLKTLTVTERKVVVYYLKGYSYMDIVTQVGINYKSVDNALSRAKKKIPHVS